MNPQKIAFYTSAPPKEHIGLNFTEKLFPLGVGFLLSIIKSMGHEVDFYDRYLYYKDRFFLAEDYDLVCIYSNTPCFEDTLRIIDYYRQPGFKNPRICVGGPHASVYPGTLKGVDYIVQGEGEEVIRDVVLGVAPKGIIRYPRIEDLDMLPRPDYELFSTMPYLTRTKWFEDEPVYNYSSSRGCPFGCSFCDTKKVWGREYTCFSAERVVDDIEYLMKTFGVKGIYFREDNFTCNKERVREICVLILKRGLRFKWACETRVNAIDKYLMALMKQAGCEVFYIGFESGSQKMLEVYNKGTTVEQGLEIAKEAYRCGIKVAGSFIFGHPQETEKDKTATLDFIEKVELNVAWMNKYRESFDSYVEKVLTDRLKKGG